MTAITIFYRIVETTRNLSFYSVYTPSIQRCSLKNELKQITGGPEFGERYDCRTPNRNTIPRLKWLGCMVPEKSTAENIGYRWKDGQS